ncbi:hypothetical protein ACFW1A_00950 [Kitasatospora sp. NPDC058965]
MRQDPDSGQVQVISREYDDPQAAPERDAAAQPRPKRRWFGRS